LKSYQGCCQARQVPIDYLLLLARAEAANEYKDSEKLSPDEGVVPLGKVDWLVKDAKAWDSLCEWWASSEFRAKSDKA
jgi:hypothetical protein